MPILAFFSVVGSVLVALLFLADATLENTSPAIVTSQRTGLPTPRYDNANAIKTLVTATAPAPDMTSQAVLAAQPKSEPEHQATSPAEERAAHGPLVLTCAVIPTMSALGQERTCAVQLGMSTKWQWRT